MQRTKLTEAGDTRLIRSSSKSIDHDGYRYTRDPGTVFVVEQTYAFAYPLSKKAPFWATTCIVGTEPAPIRWWQFWRKRNKLPRAVAVLHD